MSRNIPPRLLEHLQSGCTTIARLMRLTLADGRVYGLAALDVPVVYGGVTYSAFSGADISTIATDVGLSVDNGEVVSLLVANAIQGVTYEMALSGELDDAQWEVILVNYEDLSMGHMILDAGDIGEVKVTDGIMYTPEILSYTMRLRQNIGTVWSRRCRAIFGTDANSQTGCGVDTESMWVSGTVAQVDPDDVRRVFSDPSLIGGTDYGLGRVHWLTGRNAALNRYSQVEAFGTASGTVVLLDPVYFPIQVGDTFRIRRDCNKSPSDCKSYNNFLNYKGENMIPTGDGLETMTPGAQVFGGLSGSQVVD